MGSRCLFVILILSLGVAPLAQALGNVTFGPEFTFFNFSPNGPELRDKVFKRMRQHLVANQPGKAKFYVRELGLWTRFASPNGWWFDAGEDLGGVVEVKTIPGSVDFFRKFERDMQDAIFASASNEGFFPAMFQGGGHVNIGLGAFDGNDLLLRNFIVDLYNHNELFMGVFNYDTSNALPFDLLNPEVRRQMKAEIRAFDQAATTVNSTSAQIRLMLDLQGIQARSIDSLAVRWNRKTERGKQFAVNFTHVNMNSEGRIELRGFRPQANMDMWIRQIDLLYHRLMYLEKIKEPIPLRSRVPLLKLDFEKKEHHLNPPLDPQLALRSFYQFVTESGPEWRDHRDYLWPNWVTDGELEKFEKSAWFLERENNQDCARVLAAAA